VSDEQIQRLKSLNESETEVLHFIFRDPKIKVRDISKDLYRGEGGIRTNLTSIFEKLRVPEGEKEKREYIVREYADAYRELFLKVGEESSQSQVPPQQQNTTSSTEEARIDFHPPPPRVNRTTVIISVLAGFLIISICAVFILLGIIRTLNQTGGNKPNLPIQTATDNTISEIPPTLSPTLENTIVFPTKTQLPTNSPPIIPTTIPIALPSPTPKPYYEQGDSAILANGIYISLTPDFLLGGSTCGHSDGQFGVRFVIENTVQEQFMVRFNSGDFHAKDDLGNEYRIIAIGNDGDGFCNEPIGITLDYTQSWGYWRSYIPMVFSGKIPLKAKYIYITADWISGVGPIVFRKSIY